MYDVQEKTGRYQKGLGVFLLLFVFCGAWFVGFATENFFIGRAVRAQFTFDAFYKPEDYTSLLLPGVGAKRAIKATLGLFS